MEPSEEYPAIARARQLLGDKLLQEVLAREGEPGPKRAEATATWREELEAAFHVAAASLTELADRYTADLEQNRERVATVFNEAKLQRQQLCDQMGWRLPADVSSTGAPPEVVTTAEPPSDTPAVCDQQEGAEAGDKEVAINGASPEVTSVDQTEEAQDYGEAREADKDICEAPSSEESGDETAPALEPETIGIRSIRGISIQVRKRGLPGPAVTLQNWHRAHMLHGCDREEAREPGSVAQEMWAMAQAAARLQRRVLRSLLSLVEHKKGLRRLLSKRCLARAEAAGTVHLWYHSFSGFDAERTRRSEGRTAMAEEYWHWRVTGRALARWMSHAADGRREPLVREGNTITAMMGRGRLGGAQC